MKHYIKDQSTHLLGETLSQFITSFPQACCFKHHISKKYILVNQAFSERLGMTTKHIIDYILKDIIFNRALKLSNQLNIKILKEIDRLDDYVCRYKTSICSERNIFCTPEEILLVENYTKIPIFDNDNAVAGILGYSQDLTNQCDLFGLLKIYQQHYSLQKSIKIFLKYLKIDHYFTQPPTHRELMSLLAMFLDNSHKHVAKLLEVKAKTAETHIYQLKSKLQNISLLDVLKTMRSHNRTMSIWPKLMD